MKGPGKVKGERELQTRQKVLLIALVLLSLTQQGVRWKATKSDVTKETTSAKIVTIMSVAEAKETQTHDPNCSLVHINTAGMAELQTLPGIGPVYAERILIERKEQPFLEKHELLRISGIGEKRLSQLVDLICLYNEMESNEE